MPNTKIEIWRSSLAGAVWPDTFSAIATVEDGHPWSFFDPGVDIEDGYAYRARRLDTDTGMYSGWSPILSSDGSTVPYAEESPASPTLMTEGGTIDGKPVITLQGT
jgi:hypothetical protein